MTSLKRKHWLIALGLALLAHLAVALSMISLPGGEPMWRGGGNFEQVNTPTPGGAGVFVQLGTAGESAGETPDTSAQAETAPEQTVSDSLAQGAVAAAAEEPGAAADELAEAEDPEPASEAAPEPIESPPTEEVGPAPDVQEDAVEPESTVAITALPRRKPKRPNPMPEMEALGKRLSVQQPEQAALPPAQAEKPAPQQVRPPSAQQAPQGPPTRDGARPGGSESADDAVDPNKLSFIYKNGRIGTAGGNSTGDIRELNYGDMVMLWLKRHGEYPYQAARYRLEDTVTVRFAINRQGKILYHTLVKKSKWVILNSAVRKMMDRSTPVPPIPPEISQDEITFTVPVHFNPP